MSEVTRHYPNNLQNIQIKKERWFENLSLVKYASTTKGKLRNDGHSWSSRLSPLSSGRNTKIRPHGRNLSQDTMRRSRMFCQRESKCDNLLLVDDGIEDPNTTLNGPSSAHERTPFKLRVADGPIMA